jgi:hypothetical protein
MADVIDLAAFRNKRVRLNAAAVSEVARCVALKPGPAETADQFVSRIVSNYLEADGQGAV